MTNARIISAKIEFNNCNFAEDTVKDIDEILDECKFRCSTNNILMDLRDAIQRRLKESDDKINISFMYD